MDFAKVLTLLLNVFKELLKKKAPMTSVIHHAESGMKRLMDIASKRLICGDP
jgi:hypothetical protein